MKYLLHYSSQQNLKMDMAILWHSIFLKLNKYQNLLLKITPTTTNIDDARK